MKKIYIVSMLVLLALFSYSGGSVNAKVVCNTIERIPHISARSAVAIDSKTKIILYDKNSSQVIPMASTTKIITALVALRYGDLDKKVQISQNATGIRGSKVGYKKGELIEIRELLYGLMLRSGNDAAIAIAEGIAGSVEEYLKIMNEFSNEIGLLDTHFESPHGLDSENHYTTAYDLAILTSKAKEISQFNKIVASKEVGAETFGFSRSYHNINKILWEIPLANGVKTGYTGQAGKCLVTSVDVNGRDIVIVLLNSSERWKETNKIYDYINKQYEYRKIAGKDDEVYKLPPSSKTNEIILKTKEEIVVPVKKNSQISQKVVIPNYVNLSALKGDKIGTMQIYQDEEFLYSVALVNKDNIKKSNKIKKILSFFKNSSEYNIELEH